jgi:hypothetical protein
MVRLGVVAGGLMPTRFLRDLLLAPLFLLVVVGQLMDEAGASYSDEALPEPLESPHS